MAHEIGHLLLPAGHSEKGLMLATWELRGGLLDYFTEPQGDAMPARLLHANAQWHLQLRARGLEV